MVITPQEDEFLRIIFNASPAEVRAICARVEVDPAATPACLNLVRVLRNYADKFQANLESAGVDCG
ncbi:hypothetical protein [Paracoccus sp. SSJ]|uniref:hypothetical protein n=1 Tax=Paracoccus sp. SSJ TaxID=3050636 RepID=UPI0025518260|nr:hypothetical protein [Paracoccus sp. SSJ]MDK8871610.1 hypothetical protein [Paracoccus sp. SSJ]